tara:strand:- start:143 stop:268 length:126 start_codon:yes stop_codon:yes gene_type:complete
MGHDDFTLSGGWRESGAALDMGEEIFNLCLNIKALEPWNRP